jgi:drug/metabolite transporter (DMT)-like permease
MLSGRFLLAGALLYWGARRRGAERPTARQWGAAAAVGAALLVVDTGGVAWAEQRVASGVTALLVATVALFIVLLDRVCFGVRIAGNTALGLLVGLAGEHVGTRELVAGLVIVSSVALLAIRHERRAAPEPVAEALRPYIRRQEARLTDFRGAPRLYELPRLAA